MRFPPTSWYQDWPVKGYFTLVRQEAVRFYPPCVYQKINRELCEPLNVWTCFHSHVGIWFNVISVTTIMKIKNEGWTSWLWTIIYSYHTTNEDVDWFYITLTRNSVNVVPVFNEKITNSTREQVRSTFCLLGVCV